jgi:CheY-like chemotaxis protein
MEETLTKPLCFLLVDDDNDDQDFFKEMLEEVNPDTNLLIASDGIEALTLLHRSTVLH